MCKPSLDSGFWILELVWWEEIDGAFLSSKVCGTATDNWVELQRAVNISDVKSHKYVEVLLILMRLMCLKAGYPTGNKSKQALLLIVISTRDPVLFVSVAVCDKPVPKMILLGISLIGIWFFEASKRTSSLQVCLGSGYIHLHCWSLFKISKSKQLLKRHFL